MTIPDPPVSAPSAAPGHRSQVTGHLLSAPLLAAPLAWLACLYLAPLAVGYAVGAVPIRLISSGIMFDQTAVSLGGFRAITWSPVVVGILISLIGHRARTSPFLIAFSTIGATLAATLLIAGGALGVGPGSLLLVGAELKWIWRIVLLLAGLVMGLVAPQLLKAHAEDNQFDPKEIRRGMLWGGLAAGALVLALGPGPILGRAITGGGSWLGSLVWVVAL
jgi:hypothetical protein